MTFPFRVSGTQVRVYSETVAVGNKAAGALVYRPPTGQTQNAQPFADGSENPFHTDHRGYLQGRGELREGDGLIALLPNTSSESYTLYHTSAIPALTGLQVYTVSEFGVQTMTVS